MLGDVATTEPVAVTGDDVAVQLDPPSTDERVYTLLVPADSSLHAMWIDAPAAARRRL